MPRKICVVITARPSYARIWSALAAIRDRSDLELQLVLCASALHDRYGKLTDIVRRDGLDVAEQLFTLIEGENLVTSAKSTGLGIIELTTAFDRLKPDLVVTIADRYETLATAVAASYLNIPLVHVQGGEITGSIDEKVRHAVTKLSDLHLVSTHKARDRVIRMGERPEAVVWTGCPSIDLAAIAERDESEFDVFSSYGGVGPVLDLSGGFLMVMQHPVTTEYGAARDQIVETIEAVRRLAMPTLWFWPNVDAGSDAVSKMIRVYRERNALPHVHLFRNVAPEHFIRLLVRSSCIIGNSSVGIRECSFLGVPAVNIGARQAGRERGPNVLDVGYDRDQIVEAVTLHERRGRPVRSHLYGDGEAGVRIAAELASWAPSVEKRLTYD